eukprot:2616794-Rhodomonas_salina.1
MAPAVQKHGAGIAYSAGPPPSLAARPCDVTAAIVSRTLHASRPCDVTAATVSRTPHASRPSSEP